MSKKVFYHANLPFIMSKKVIITEQGAVCNEMPCELFQLSEDNICADCPFWSYLKKNM